MQTDEMTDAASVRDTQSGYNMLAGFAFEDTLLTREEERDHLVKVHEAKTEIMEAVAGLPPGLELLARWAANQGRRRWNHFFVGQAEETDTPLKEIATILIPLCHRELENGGDPQLLAAEVTPYLRGIRLPYNYDQRLVEAAEAWVRQTGGAETFAGETAQARARRARQALRRFHRHRDQLVQRNMRWVYSVVERTAPSASEGHRADLIHEGALGMMHAIDKFDVRRRDRFTTYATNWIAQAVQRKAPMHQNTVHLPAYFDTIVGQVRRFMSQEKARTGVFPTRAEIEAAVEIPGDRVDEVLNAIHGEVELDEPIRGEGNKEEGGASFLDWMTADDPEAFPEERAIESDRREQIQAMLDVLPEVEKGVMTRVYGLDGREAASGFREIGSLFGFSSERARQIHHRALEKIRAAHTSFLEGDMV